MRRRALPPFSVKKMLRDPNGLLTRLELAFALEPVHKIRPSGQMQGQRGGRRSGPPQGESSESGEE